jgi:hypothetical protein
MSSGGTTCRTDSARHWFRADIAHNITVELHAVALLNLLRSRSDRPGCDKFCGCLHVFLRSCIPYPSQSCCQRNLCCEFLTRPPESELRFREKSASAIPDNYRHNQAFLSDQIGFQNSCVRRIQMERNNFPVVVASDFRLPRCS